MVGGAHRATVALDDLAQLSGEPGELVAHAAGGVDDEQEVEARDARRRVGEGLREGQLDGHRVVSEAHIDDAADLGVPVYFNGFVENSVVETEKRVRAIYEGEDISHGFGIDPTLFERFDVVAVPTLISTTVDMDVCETTDCSGDLIPAHDRIAGNVPLRRALELIARGNGDHWAPAADILDADG